MRAGFKRMAKEKRGVRKMKPPAGGSGIAWRFGGDLKARDIMRSDVVFAGSGMSIAELAELLEAHGVTGVPVVSGKGKVIGVVSETDIAAAGSLRGAGQQTPYYFKSGWAEGKSGAEIIDDEKMSFSLEKKVEDIMTPWVISVTEDASVEEIARKMVNDRVHRVLVMDSKGHLKGIVSSMDLVQLVAKAGRV